MLVPDKLVPATVPLNVAPAAVNVIDPRPPLLELTSEIVAPALVAAPVLNCILLVVPDCIKQLLIPIVFPPTYKFFSIPTPPVTFNAPVVLLVESVALVKVQATPVVAPLPVTVARVSASVKDVRYVLVSIE